MTVASGTRLKIILEIAPSIGSKTNQNINQNEIVNIIFTRWQQLTVILAAFTKGLHDKIRARGNGKNNLELGWGNK
jgi:hypothetical protein